MKNKVVLLAVIVIVLCGMITFTATTKWSNSRSIIKADGLIYFLYARSIVLDLNTDLTNEFGEIERHFNEAAITPAKQYMELNQKNGKIAFPFPIGAGLLMSPFYALGYGVEYLVALINGRTADSYGQIPIYFFGIGALVYGLLGFWFMFICCAQVANQKVAYTSAVAIALAGLIVFYVFFHPTMAHAPSFAFAALFFLIWWRRWHEKTNGIAILSFILGILVTIRYQNIMFMILIMIIFIRNSQKMAIKNIFRNAAVGGMAFAIPFSIQIFHWISIHGLSAHDIGFGQGGGFVLEQNEVNFLSPNFFNVLFSCQHGLFYWTPVYLLGFSGLVWASRKEKWALAFLAAIFVNVYLIGCLGSPHNWSGGGLYGMRYLTECSPLMAVGLSVLIRDTNKIVTMQWWWVLLSILIVWNGMLILAFSLQEISQCNCVTIREMAVAMVHIFMKIFVAI
jgi:hypothetical protein